MRYPYDYISHTDFIDFSSYSISLTLSLSILPLAILHSSLCWGRFSCRSQQHSARQQTTSTSATMGCDRDGLKTWIAFAVIIIIWIDNHTHDIKIITLDAWPRPRWSTVDGRCIILYDITMCVGAQLEHAGAPGANVRCTLETCVRVRHTASSGFVLMRTTHSTYSTRLKW